MIYIVLYEALILGGCSYIVFWKDQNPWWFLLAVLLSMSAYKPDYYKIEEK
jgi:hypothetical protein